MLRRFNVKNFLSFNQREDGSSEEFSMIPGKVRNKSNHLINDGSEKLLKYAAIYGANAAGKTNVVKAMDFMRKVIVSGIPNKYTEKYCKTDTNNRSNPSYFEVELRINQTNYSYGFEICLNTKKIVSEWLVAISNDGKDEKEIFTRDLSEHKYSLSGWKDKKLKERLEIYMSDISEDDSTLFLSIMNDKKTKFYAEYKEAGVLCDIYRWFRTTLEINFPNEPLSDYSYLGEVENIEKICKLIAAFGTGITNYKIVKVNRDMITENMMEDDKEHFAELIDAMVAKVNAEDTEKTRRIRMIMRSKQEFFIVEVKKNDAPLYKTINFFHSSKQYSFGLNEESDGTIRLLDLLVVLLNNKKEKVYVIDELDRCLHPCLTYKFVQEFLAQDRNNKVQLITTTHESRLLDFDLLRRDEVWFVNKRNTGESDIYSLEEYNERFDKRIDKAYLEGRYGGVPIFTSVFPLEDKA